MTPLPTTGRHLVLTHRRKEGRKCRNIRNRKKKTAPSSCFQSFLSFLPSCPSCLPAKKDPCQIRKVGTRGLQSKLYRSRKTFSSFRMRRRLMDNCPFFSVSSAFDLPLFAIWTMIMCDLYCKQVLIQGTRLTSARPRRARPWIRVSSRASRRCTSATPSRSL